ncbi:hypothetical protein QRX50_18275 [Amycolatopsis carbonis]|uniref:Uncharacterized protein n=1 Tax=Amycolatopsis carbonis TaxID=715471 RepID=A0A9Y2IMD8_9PSEU|nr:hypothetical protein [Amycolatopsis sp. 2-15]WIX82574.1 hypothetical protein QRX50_18275 [Amycolatopsis sp. 2-15]
MSLVDTAEAGEVLSLQWIVGPQAELAVQESGSDPARPPLLVLSGARCVLTLSPPDDVGAWHGCAELLRQLRDNADEMAALLDARATELRASDEYQD